MSIETRALRHAALGDKRRLLIVDELAHSDRTVDELAELVGMRSNLIAHHLAILEKASLIERKVSEGDQRRKYVALVWESLPEHPGVRSGGQGRVAFVCTHNSARSQFAAALWELTTGLTAESAGSQPASSVHPLAIKAASRLGVDLSEARPGGYARIKTRPGIVVSVCDRARESGLPEADDFIHWSVHDPVRIGTLRSFQDAFVEISRRVERLASASERVR
jgi:protein-tyrosine-phosphatase